MRLELFRDGELYMSIESTDGELDFAILPKQVAKNSSLSSRSFEELYFDCFKHTESKTQAYQMAEKIHSEYFGSAKYSDYDSFRKVKSHRLKR